MVDVVTPPPDGEWTHQWTCKARGCGATLKAKGSDVYYDSTEDSSGYRIACPLCGTSIKIDPPPAIANVAGRRR